MKKERQIDFFIDKKISDHLSFNEKQIFIKEVGEFCLQTTHGKTDEGIFQYLSFFQLRDCYYKIDVQYDGLIIIAKMIAKLTSREFLKQAIEASQSETVKVKISKIEHREVFSSN